MCDTLCALPPATARGTALFAKNSDRPLGEPQDLEWHPARRDRGPLRCTHVPVDPHPDDTLGVLGSRPRWMWGMEHGVNEAGLAVGNEAVWTTANPARVPDALTGMDLVRLVLERAAGVDEGVALLADLLDRHGQGGACHESGRRYWSSFLLADHGAAVVVETSGRDVAVEAVGDRRAISNRLTIPDFDAEHGIDPSLLETMVDPRLAASRSLLERGAVDVEDLVAHLRGHEGGPDGWTICMHAPDEATTAGMVVALPEQGPVVARAVLGQPCRSVFVPVLVGEPLGTVPAWERFAALDDEAAAALAPLEAELSADVAAARPGEGWNAQAWARVSDALAALGR